jgi:hypothetical protein
MHISFGSRSWFVRNTLRSAAGSQHKVASLHHHPNSLAGKNFHHLLNNALGFGTMFASYLGKPEIPL